MYPSLSPLSALAKFMRPSTPQSLLANTKKEIQECATLEPHHRSLITDSRGNQDVNWPIERMAALAVDEFHVRNSEQKNWLVKLSPSLAPAMKYERSEPVYAIEGMQKLLEKEKGVIGDNRRILKHAAESGSTRLFELLLERGAKPSPEVSTMLGESLSKSQMEYSTAGPAEKPLYEQVMLNQEQMDKLNKSYMKVREFIQKLQRTDNETPGIQKIKRELKAIVKAEPEDQIGIVNSKGDYEECNPIEAIAYYAGQELFERAKDMHAALDNPDRLEPEHSIGAMREVLKKELPMIIQLFPYRALQKAAATGSEPLFSLLLEHNVRPLPEETESLLDGACASGRQTLKDLEKSRPSGSTASSPEAWKKWIEDLSVRLDKKIERMKLMPEEHKKKMNQISIANEQSLLEQIENEKKMETEKQAAPGVSKSASAKKRARRKAKAAVEEKLQPPRLDTASNPLRIDAPLPSTSPNPFAPLMELRNPGASVSMGQKKSKQWRKVETSTPLPTKPAMSASRMGDATLSGHAEPSAKPERHAMVKESSRPLSEAGVSNAPRLNEPLNAKEDLGAVPKGKETSPFRPAEKPTAFPKITKAEKAAPASQAGKGKAREPKKPIWQMVVHRPNNPSTAITMGDASSRRWRPVARPQQQAPAAVPQAMPELTDAEAFPELRESQNGMESPMPLAENNSILEKFRNVNWDAVTEPFPPDVKVDLQEIKAEMQKRWDEAMRQSQVKDSGVVIYSSENV